MVIEINNLTNFPISKTFFTGVAKKVLRGENRERECLSIAFVAPEEIQKLNRQYRKKDMPTDVLSFERVTAFKDEYSEVVVCPAVVKEKTRDSKLSFKKELADILIHGILHVIGYDHEHSAAEEAKMEQRQQWYLSKVK